MSSPKTFPVDSPCASGARASTSVVSPNETPVPQLAFTDGEPPMATEYPKVAFIGRRGSGRNSLAWRLGNLDYPELPTLIFREVQKINLNVATRNRVGFAGVAELEIRIMPPHRPEFYNKLDAIVFVLDIADSASYNEIYANIKEAKKQYKGKKVPPFFVVGNKRELRLLEVCMPFNWGETFALPKDGGHGYLECSCKTGDGVGEVLDRILRLTLLADIKVSPNQK